jgi:hypothetical protein
MVALTEDRLDILTRALTALSQDQCLGLSIPFFSDDEISDLKKETAALPMRRARDRVSHKGVVVFQDFDICFPAPRQGALENLCHVLETGCNQANAKMSEPVLRMPYHINDLAVQNYPAQSKGIGIHRDGLRYRQIVFIITLAGQSRLCLCQDRDGNGATVIDDRPGRLVLLSAPDFAGRDGDNGRPLHFVDQVTDGRLSIGLRQEIA